MEKFSEKPPGISLLEKLFKETGEILLSMGLVDSHSGNMSVLIDGRVFITRTKSMLGRLKKGDIVHFDLNQSPYGIPENASQESIVHAEIYRRKGEGAIIHAHPPSAVSLSLILPESRINPVDHEGRLLLKEVPIVDFEPQAKKEDIGKEICIYLKETNIVLVRGHGSFSFGKDLYEALMYTSCLEYSSMILINKFILEGRKG